MPGWRNGIPACRQAGAHDTTMWYLYILKSINTGRFYKGLTGDLDERLKGIMLVENQQLKLCHH